MNKSADVTKLDSTEVLLIPVTGEEPEPEEAEEEGTLGADGVSGEETPAQGEEDERLAQVKEWEGKYAKIQEDLNKIKSASQRREDELKKDFKKRELEYKKQLDQLRRASLDEPAAKQYEYETALQRIQELEEESAQRAQEVEAQRQFSYWKDRFIDEYSVPRSKLNLDEGVAELVQSGMDAIKDILSETRQEKLPIKKAKSAQEPPETLKPVKGEPTKAMTLSEAAKKYTDGDIERLFRLFDTGQLKQDIANQIAQSYETKD